MIFKIFKHFNIGIPNLKYRSPGMAQEFSQRTLTNMGYFWDENRKVYYFGGKKNGKKIYNFDDPTEFIDSTTEPHVVDGQPIGAPQVDAVMHDVIHGDSQGSGIGVKYGNESSIITMLQNMQAKKDERYKEGFRRRDAFEAPQEERFLLIQEHMTTQDTNFEAFASYVTEKLLSMWNEMTSNPDAIISRINHMISIQDENHYHCAQFYLEM
ncbi:unnamed protein product [Vicia faba]|uniref:Uncharacterized protein n=1 Tax=Vicia faba TaxID=3906 RepID=A0AAV0YW62_VICFA|nr:unnamed protein product [Vicia faba]